MSRAIWKPLYNTNLIENLEKNNIYKIYARGDTISPKFLNTKVKIYNGIRFFETIITKPMLGHKFGEYAPSRRIPLHKKKKLKNKKKPKK